MRKLFLSALVALLTTAGFAQNAPANPPGQRTPEQRADRLTAWMAKTVTLNDDQKAKVQAVNLKYARLNQEIKTEDQGNRGSLWKDIKANEAERDAELKAVLTPEQFQTYTTAKQQMAEKVKQRKENK